MGTEYVLCPPASLNVRSTNFNTEGKGQTVDSIYRAGLVAQWVDASCPWLAVSEDSVLLPSIAWIISLQHILQALPSLFVPCFFFAHSTGPAFLTPRPPPAAKKKAS